MNLILTGKFLGRKWSSLLTLLNEVAVPTNNIVVKGGARSATELSSTLLGRSTQGYIYYSRNCLSRKFGDHDFEKESPPVPIHLLYRHMVLSYDTTFTWWVWFITELL